MKTVGVLLALLMICVASEAGPLHQINNKISALQAKVEAVLQKIEPKNPWTKLNSAPVCFGAKNSQFGSFTASNGGNLMKIKLVHLYGYVTCMKSHDNYWSYWGCGYDRTISSDPDYTAVLLTTTSDTILFPPSQIGRSDKWTLIPGYSSRSPELVMSIYDTPVSVSAGQELRLWYNQDLRNVSEDNNAGRVCADVFGYFM